MRNVIQNTLTVALLGFCVTSGMDAKTVTIHDNKKITTGRMYELSDLVDRTEPVLEQFLDILQNKEVFIDCYMPQCGPCKQIKPIIEKLAQDYTDVLFIAVNTDKFSDIALKYGIKAAPTCIFFKNGKEIKRSVGAAKNSELKKLLP